MTSATNDPWLLAQGAQPTVPILSIQDVGSLCEMWIRDPDLFRRARPYLREIHFERFTDFGNLYTALCVADQRFSVWNEQILVSQLYEQVEARGLPVRPDALERFTRPGPGGFIHDAVSRGPLSPTELASALQLQERFLIEKTVFMPLRNFVSPGRFGEQQRPEDVVEFLRVVTEHHRRVSTQSLPSALPVQEMWESHEQQLDLLRGRRMVGLETGLSTLDRNLLGLRGVSLLGAAPGAGKTVLCLQIAHGVSARAEVNNAVVVFFSLELSADDLLTRLKCHLTGSRWQDYVRGMEVPDEGLRFTEEMIVRRDAALGELRDNSAGNRLLIVDRSHIRQHSPEHLAAIVNEHKERMGAERSLAIIDYLQLLELDKGNDLRSDLDADKARFRIIQQIAELTRSESHPHSSAVVAISEARKPVGDARKNQMWGTAMADLMGTSRLGYGADAVLMMRRMTNDDLSHHYGTTSETEEDRVQQLRSQGIAPLVLSIGKGRDGMSLGDIPLEFHFHTSTMRELENGSRTGGQRPQLRRQRPRLASATEAAQ